ncbi:MAG: glycosyltransferase family 2 protein [Lachnospiraceae bacterium]|nr:glycosyltransferase family 2 protein [Lachnospiraceae bacterium]
MKLLTIAIPCYNSAAYMKKAIDHASMGGDDVEILVIDDGSTDSTLEIAREYESRMPGIVRAIHQENRGHGGAVMTGLREAAGLYFKVCDSDDYLDFDSLQMVLNAIRQVLGGAETLDALITNYVYDKQGARRKREIRYTRFFPEERIFTWNEMIRPLSPSRYVLMHSVTYRTELLRECGMELPEHTFYVDNLVAFTPMIYVKTLYYIDTPLYWYYIGREDQSVNEEVMMGRIDQQILVTKTMIDSYRPGMVKNRKHLQFLVHYMSIMMTVSSILLMRIGTEDALAKKKELWQYLKKKDMRLYLKLRHSLLGSAMNMPGKAGRDAAVKCYKIVQRFVGFN